LIERADDRPQAVALLVDGILNVAKSPEANATGWRGCLIGNTALELGADDPEIVERLRKGVETLRALARKAIALPSPSGVKRSEREIDQAALQLVAGVQGLLVLAKSGLSAADVKTARAAIVAAIN